MRALVTRPSREAQSWIQALKSAGHEPIAVPLIEIEAVADSQPLSLAWQHIHRYQAVMFVSANAVDFFFEAKPPFAPSIFSHGGSSIRAWATGPGTARALEENGASAAWIDTPNADSLQFDSEALWAKVAGQIGAGSQVLIVRGIDSGQETSGSGRDWLAQRIEASGGLAEFVVAYRRQLPAFTPAQQALLRAASTDGTAWLFSSSQAVVNLAASFPELSWSRARAVATHRRIAQTALSYGFGVVCESRPTVADVIASIESLA